MSDGINFITPVLVDETGMSDSTWEDVDISDAAYSTVDNSATGLLLAIEVTSGTPHVGNRSKGHSALAPDGDHGVDRSYHVVGLEAGIFQIFSGDLANTLFYILGYFGSAAQFHSSDYDAAGTTPDEITPGTAGSYQSVDITAHVDSGVAVCALMTDDNTNSNVRYAGARETGGSFTGYYDHEGQVGLIHAVDANEAFEIIVENTSTNNVYLLGYMTDGFTDVAYTDKSATASDAWQTKTSDGTTNAVGSVLHCPGVSSHSNGVSTTPQASAAQPYVDRFTNMGGTGAYAWVQNNSSGEFDVLRDQSSSTFAEAGYFTDVVAGGGATPKGPLGHPLAGALGGPV